MDEIPIEGDEDLHYEIEELREELLQADTIVHTLKSKLRIQRQETQQFVAAWKTKLQDIKRDAKHKEKIREKQLQNITSNLFYLEGQLRKEKREIELLLQEKDGIIESQRQTIERLKQECHINKAISRWKESEEKKTAEKEPRIIGQNQNMNAPLVDNSPSFLSETNKGIESVVTSLLTGPNRQKLPSPREQNVANDTSQSQRRAMASLSSQSDHHPPHQSLRGNTQSTEQRRGDHDPTDNYDQYKHLKSHRVCKENIYHDISPQENHRSLTEAKYFAERPRKDSSHSPLFQPSYMYGHTPYCGGGIESSEYYAKNRINNEYNSFMTQEKDHYLAKGHAPDHNEKRPAAPQHPRRSSQIVVRGSPSSLQSTHSSSRSPTPTPMNTQNSNNPVPRSPNLESYHMSESFNPPPHPHRTQQVYSDGSSHTNRSLPMNPLSRTLVSESFSGGDSLISPPLPQRARQAHRGDGSPRWKHQTSDQSSSSYYDDGNESSSSSNSSYENVFSSPGVHDPSFPWVAGESEEQESGEVLKRKTASLPVHSSNAPRNSPAHRTGSWYSQGYD